MIWNKTRNVSPLQGLGDLWAGYPRAARLRSLARGYHLSGFQPLKMGWDELILNLVNVEIEMMAGWRLAERCFAFGVRHRF
jgi:hypothetical protein